MAKKNKRTSEKPAKDRHLTPVILTASGQVVAGRRRIEKFCKEHPEARVVISEMHHYAMAAGYLHAARDEDGHLHLATTSRADEEGWTLVADEKGGRHGSP